MEQRMHVAPFRLGRAVLIVFMVLCVASVIGIIVHAVTQPPSFQNLLPVLPAAWLLFFFGASSLER